MTTNDGWIKMSERAEGGDFPWPVLVANADTGQVHYWRTFDEMKRCEPLWTLYTHYKAANLPAPPPKELSQWQKDEEAFDVWFKKEFGTYPHDYSLGQRPAWHAALAYRDKQNAEDLKRFGSGIFITESDWVTSVHNLRRRCGLDQ